MSEQQVDQAPPPRWIGHSYPSTDFCERCTLQSYTERIRFMAGGRGNTPAEHMDYLRRYAEQLAPKMQPRPCRRPSPGPQEWTGSYFRDGQHFKTEVELAMLDIVATQGEDAATTREAVLTWLRKHYPGQFDKTEPPQLSEWCKRANDRVPGGGVETGWTETATGCFPNR